MLSEEFTTVRTESIPDSSRLSELRVSVVNLRLSQAMALPFGRGQSAMRSIMRIGLLLASAALQREELLQQLRTIVLEDAADDCRAMI